MKRTPIGKLLFWALLSVLLLTACENVTGSSDDDDDSSSSSPATTDSSVTLRINACDLEHVGATSGDRLVVWVYPDETPWEEYYGDQRNGILVAEAFVLLDAYGEGAGMVCQVGTSTPMLLEPTFYVLTAFIDTDDNGVPSSGEIYAAGRDVDVSEDTTYTFDDPDFTQTFP